MRYIDTSAITVPENWLELAKANMGNNHASLWSYLRPNFIAIVGKKCWYSESINIGADNDIEHFRPKGANVRQLRKENADLDQFIWDEINADTRIGYSFLKYELSNYRYACTFVNSPRQGNNNKTRGKSNFFPLKIDSIVASVINDLPNEEICLLDPCNPTDPGLVTFNEFGYVIPHIALSDNNWNYFKVKISIEIYHLEYYLFRDSRLELWNTCKEHIELANGIYVKPTKSNEEEISLLYHIRQLNLRIKKTAEFSAVAVDCILHYKNNFPWLDLLFPNDILNK